MSLSASAFRRVFEYHLINCTACEPTYVDQFRTLDMDSVVEDPRGKHITVNLEFLRDFELWTPTGSNGDGRLNEFRKDCEVAYFDFVSAPLKYLEVIDHAARDVYTLLRMVNQELDEEMLRQADLVLTKADVNVSASTLISQSSLGSQIRVGALRLFVDFTGGIRLTGLKSLNSAHLNQIVRTKGICIQVTKPYMKVQTLVCQCSSCGAQKVLKLPPWNQGASIPRKCEGALAIDVNAPGAGAVVSCPIDPYTTLCELSTYQDIQKVKCQELPDDVAAGEMPRHIQLSMSGHLVGRVVPGSRIEILGVYTCQMDHNKTGSDEVKQAYIHVIGLKSESGSKSIGMQMSGSIASEMQRLASSPDIVTRIYASIAPVIHGYSEIKKSIACMLFGGSRKRLRDGSSTRGDIHVLLLGDPSTAKSQLLKFVSLAAPVSVYTSGKGSSAAGLTAALVRDSSGNYALEGGAMVLADGGVVCIDEFDKMRDVDRVAIHEAMEQQTISIAKAGINAMLSTECAILAAANPTFGSYDTSKETSDQHTFETTILSRFDAIWLVRDLKNEETDRAIAKHVFSLHKGRSNAASDNSEFLLPLPLLKTYIQYCRCVSHPIMEMEASKTLENFYVEIRGEARSHSGRGKRNQIPITVRQLESIVRTAESLAKMTLAPTVQLTHINEAIRLFKLSTVETSRSSTTLDAESASLSSNLISRCEQALLQRLPIGANCNKGTISRDLKMRGFTADVISATFDHLISRGVLTEPHQATIKRIAAGL